MCHWLPSGRYHWSSFELNSRLKCWIPSVLYRNFISLRLRVECTQNIRLLLLSLLLLLLLLIFFIVILYVFSRNFEQLFTPFFSSSSTGVLHRRMSRPLPSPPSTPRPQVSRPPTLCSTQPSTHPSPPPPKISDAHCPSSSRRPLRTARASPERERGEGRKTKREREWKRLFVGNLDWKKKEPSSAPFCVSGFSPTPSSRFRRFRRVGWALLPPLLPLLLFLFLWFSFLFLFLLFLLRASKV